MRLQWEMQTCAERKKRRVAGASIRATALEVAGSSRHLEGKPRRRQGSNIYIQVLSNEKGTFELPCIQSVGSIFFFCGDLI
jgi:hypothetical protein